MYLNTPVNSAKGRTKKDQFLAFERMSGDKHPALEVPSIPPELSYLVSLYLDLGEFSYQNLNAYMNVTGSRFNLYEIEVFKAIERARKEGYIDGSD